PVGRAFHTKNASGSQATDLDYLATHQLRTGCFLCRITISEESIKKICIYKIPERTFSKKRMKLSTKLFVIFSVWLLCLKDSSVQSKKVYVLARLGKPIKFTTANPVVRPPNSRNCGNGFVYDPYFEKCRKLVCAFKGYHVKNGKCVKS
ncbi:hypothetical protein CEXT_711431, partial [Caerostris extrusa]